MCSPDIKRYRILNQNYVVNSKHTISIFLINDSLPGSAIQSAAPMLRTAMLKVKTGFYDSLQGLPYHQASGAKV